MAALTAALLSVGLNAYLIGKVRRPEEWAGPAVERVFARLESEDARIRYEVRVPAGTPIRLDIPVDERFAIRVDTTIPVRTVVNLPIRSPLGNHNVRVPVRANVPLRSTVPIHVRHTVRLRTSTPQEIVVPLEIRLRDLPLDELRRSLNPR